MRLIDANKLVMHLADFALSMSGKPGYSEIQQCMEAAEEQPTVDPVKHGRWLDDYNAEENPFFRKGWKCSACGSRNTYGKPKFCMNCGAQMDGESNET